MGLFCHIGGLFIIAHLIMGVGLMSQDFSVGHVLVCFGVKNNTHNRSILPHHTTYNSEHQLKTLFTSKEPMCLNNFACHPPFVRERRDQMFFCCQSAHICGRLTTKMGLITLLWRCLLCIHVKNTWLLQNFPQSGQYGDQEYNIINTTNNTTWQKKIFYYFFIKTPTDNHYPLPFD